MAERIHELVTTTAPSLVPKTYYGMPAYAKDGKVICFFKPASKFKVRYSTFEFQADAHLDDGELWPVSFAVTRADSSRGGADRRAREEGHRLRPSRRWPAAVRSEGPSPALHQADSHDLIRVHGARENNLKDISIEIPKRRLTVFTGVSGSGKSSLVFDTIAAESRRLIDETYSTFVQVFMPTLARPDVDVLDGLTTAIIVDQERLGANPRSTLGTVTDAHAMLRSLFSRLGKPHIGGPTAFSFNIPTTRASGVMTGPKGEKKIVRDAVYLGGMCAECEGRGTVSDLDLSVIVDESKSLAEGAILVPGYTADGWMVATFIESGFFDPRKPIRDYSERERHDLLYKPTVRIKAKGINVAYDGLIPKIRKSIFSKDVDSLQPHLKAFVERAAVFKTCPVCDGSRLNEAARSSKIRGQSIADVCALQVTDATDWLRGIEDKGVAPLVANLLHLFDAFIEIGLGYLSLDRPSGTLSGGESQRTKMVRHIGSALTDVTYVFDEPTIGLHPHDIQRMNNLLLELRDKGNTVLVVEHKPETIAIADHVVDLGPGAGTGGGTVCFEGSVEGLRASDTPHRPSPRPADGAQGHGPDADRQARDPRRGPAQPPGRRRRRPARGAGRRHRRRRFGQELADPRLGRGPGRRGRGRPGRRSRARAAATPRRTPGCSTRSARRSRRPTASSRRCSRRIRRAPAPPATGTG